MPVGHGGNGQGTDRGSGGGDRRRHSPGQHLPPDAAAERRAGEAAGRPAPVHALGEADPDGQRRLPGDVASKISKVTEEAATFQSHIDGSRHVLSPERSIEIQADLLGPTSSCSSTSWWRCRQRQCRGRGDAALGALGRPLEGGVREREAQALFGIQQGGTSRVLRRESAERLSETGFDGYALAAWRWARATRRCARCSTSPRACCRPSGPAT
jgi:hypothetical protein